jgi:hypothetical protein
MPKCWAIQQPKTYNLTNAEILKIIEGVAARRQYRREIRLQ